MSKSGDDDSSLGACSESVAHDLDDPNASKTTESESESKSIREQLTKKETETVFRLRLLVILVLLLTAVAVCLVIYFVTHKGEVRDFDSQYDAAAQKVIDSFDGIIKEMGAISGVGIAATAHSVDYHTQWPFMTLSSFQQRANNAKDLSGVLFLSIMPIVETDERQAWEQYVNGGNNSWIDEGYAYQEANGLNDFENLANAVKLTNRTVDPIHYLKPDISGNVVDEGPGPYLCIWQTSPVLKNPIINENFFKRPGVGKEPQIVIDTGVAYIGGFMSSSPGDAFSANPVTAFFALLKSIAEGKPMNYAGDPVADLYFPIFDSFNTTTQKTVAVLNAILEWKTYFRNLLPSNINGVVVVLENTCNGTFTYVLNGEDEDVIPVGFGDHHDNKFDAYERTSAFGDIILKDGTIHGIELEGDDCKYVLHVYPSQRFKDAFTNNNPQNITCGIAGVFGFCIILFVFYDRLVERRQKIILAAATQSTAIVSSLFPKNVRERLMQQEKENVPNGLANKTRLKGFLDGTSNGTEANAAPIADLFPNCTVFFCDIAGFTAWSSTREPSQVFILLQSVYQAFDAQAKRRKVFKVETIGDSYMAVTGLPEPMENHAVTMVRFSWDCLHKMRDVVEALELSLGPGTGDLSIRVGLHSGPVTAGVLRGDRARFQLFGDTVNTASRMESTGTPGRVQISASTAKALRLAGKAEWCKPRDDQVVAKGKGVIETYWVNPRPSNSKQSGSSASGHSSDLGAEDRHLPQFTPERIARKEKGTSASRTRLVNWMADLLLDDIKKIVHVRRENCGKKGANPVIFEDIQSTKPMDEIVGCIVMPQFDARKAACLNEYKGVEIDDAVLKELRDFVALIASMYRDNPFHNFEHACHVTMSVKKLLKRVISPEFSSDEIKLSDNGTDSMAKLHDYTHGINSDPLTSLAVTWSALIHDVDHRGVSNMQLAKEVPEMDKHYQNKSLAEQNSVDVAWTALMQKEFKNLRGYLFGSQDELLRFRQLVVNVVLATDIFDKELNDLRKDRWAKAFAGKDGVVPTTSNNDLRATIVLEHIIQASDVSHTMQHWHVYQKWNKCLFKELYKAFQAGRMAKNPADFWYHGELGFFDNYIIPLARKLADCGVFGVSSDEYLNYALQNREEWERRGGDVVAELVAQVGKEHPSSGSGSGLTNVAVDCTIGHHGKQPEQAPESTDASSASC